MGIGTASATKRAFLGAAFVIGLLGVLSARSAVADVVWLSVAGEFTYSDASTSCHVTASVANRIYLILQVENGQVVRAKFKRNAFTLSVGEALFRPEEAAGITVTRDTDGYFWVTRLPLGGRLISWLVKTYGSYFCSIPEALRTVQGAPLPFQFSREVRDPLALVSRSVSQTIPFQGVRWDGMSYTASLRLYQELFEPRPL